MAERAKRPPHPLCRPGTEFSWSPYLTRLFALASAPLLGALVACVVSPPRTPEYLVASKPVVDPAAMDPHAANGNPASQGAADPKDPNPDPNTKPPITPVPEGVSAIPEDLSADAILGAGPTISFDGARTLFSQGSASFVDTRSPDDFKASHVPGSLSLQAAGGQGGLDAIRLARLTSANKPVVVYGDDPGVVRLVADRLSKASVSRTIRTWETDLADWKGAALAVATGPDLDPAALTAELLAKPEVSEHEAYVLHAQGAASFVDAREREAFLEGHVDGAWNLSPVMANDPAKAKRVGDLLQLLAGEGRPIVVYCIGHECTDARDIAARLRGVGIQNVIVMTGAYTDWQAAGYPTSTDDDDELLRFLTGGE